MSKLSRSVLKEIVKECIMEVFEESFYPPKGFSNSEMNERLQESRSMESPTRQRRPQQGSNSRSRPTHLDNVTYNRANVSEQDQLVKEGFNKKINALTNNLTSDPVMSSIFRDTAKTTLQAQIGAESSGTSRLVAAPADAAARAVSQSDPTELFAESAGKWASLAFGDSPIKR